MEHESLKKLIESRIENINDRTTIINNLLEYAKHIHMNNAKFNITGHKSIDEIISNLIINSILPLSGIDVPRGTLLGDLGSGSGIPGIPLTLFNENLDTTLFDSNSKKIRFINSLARKFDNRFRGVAGRIEEIGHDETYREKYDIITSRAMSDIYTVSELGSPLLKVGGFLILYTKENESSVPGYNDHFSQLGLTILPEYERHEFLKKESDEVFILKKSEKIPIKFPRRINSIKRALRSISEQ